MTQTTRAKPRINNDFDQSYVIAPEDPVAVRQAGIILTDVALRKGCTTEEIREVLQMIGCMK